jgi:hypothetical protein
VVVIACGTVALPADANARSWHYYGRIFGSSYAQATHVYAARHYYRRPPQQSFNPDFQLGSNR